MVCKPDEEDDISCYALCVVRDFSGVAAELKVQITVPPTMTCGQFVRDVAKMFNFDSSSIRLVSPCKQTNAYQFVLTETMPQTLKSIGVDFGLNNRNLFIVEGVERMGRPRRISSREDDLELGASASPEETTLNEWPIRMADNLQAKKYIGDLDRGAKESDAYEATEDGAKSKRIAIRQLQLRGEEKYVVASIDSLYSIGYRGLINQAMTCYLNSLLQALFMTPEFRNALYNWKYVPGPGGDEYKSIPYQLQKLFLNLQTSQRRAVETTDLTRSFGWDSSEAWQQHDIQELCRVMFDALEQEFKGTEQADLINRLYQGKMIDYVKCLECGTEKSREDTFLDIPLPVRPFGSNVAYSSVEEALAAFIQPETLEENNQYFCERCNKKCNAHKGLKFTKFPYLLTLHLMRFDFDYTTMHRIKLSDKVEFPKTLNLNGYVAETNITSNMYKEEGSEGFPEEIAGSSSKCDDSSTTDSGSAIDDENCLTSSNDLNNVDYEQEDDEGIDVGNQHENEKIRGISLEASGPYVYELFSIMVHSGSASGGHYYVYIKDFATGVWYCFNDQNVSKITNDDIDRSFGGSGPSRGYYSGVYSSSMNAYMLMYRRIDAELNVLPLKEDEFPPHIKTLVKEMNEKNECDWKLRGRQTEPCKIKIFCHHPLSEKMIDMKVECSSNSTLKDVLHIAYKKLQLELAVPLAHCRLVLYNSQTDSVENCLEGKELDEISSVFQFHKRELLLELRKSDDKFPIYKDRAVSINLHRVFLNGGRVVGPIATRTSLNNALSEFKDELYQQSPWCPIPPTTPLLVYVEIDNGTPKLLDDDDRLLRNMGVTTHSKIFICDVANANDPKCRHEVRTLIKRFLNTINLTIVLPNIKPEIFKRLSIPTLSEYAAKNEKVEDTSKSDTTNFTNVSSNVTPTTNNNYGLPMAVTNVIMASGNDALSTDANQVNSQNIIPASGCHSDQSTSEDSSLTDNDRTIVGDNQEDCQLSSSGSSPRFADDRWTSLEGDKTTSAAANYEYSYTFDEFGLGDADQSEEEYDYCKEISRDVSVADEKSVRIEVDKRMRMETFEKHLEQYVEAPRAYFKLCTDGKAHGNAYLSYNSKLVTSLRNVENNSQLHARLTRASEPGATTVAVYFLELTRGLSISYFCDYCIDDEKTVGETKKELLEDVEIMYNIHLQFDSCRLRKKASHGVPDVVYLNHQKWKDIALSWNRELYLQELDEDEQITNVESQKPLIIICQSSLAETGLEGPVQEIIIDELTVNALRKKVAEVSCIPEENVALGELSWSAVTQSTNVSDYLYNSDTEINWNTLMSQLTDADSSPSTFDYRGQIIYYKDNRLSKKYGGKLVADTFVAHRNRTHREKSLKIHVSAAT